jgi:hypothetical protein
MILSGIEPVNFRFVAQYLNHCASAIPRLRCIKYYYVFCAVVGLDNKLYKRHGAYNKLYKRHGAYIKILHFF